MIKSLIVFGIFLQSSVVTIPNYSNDRASREAETKVYICNSKSAKKYHYTKSCRGLNACTHGVIQVSLATAKSTYGRTLCGWED